MYTPLVLDHFKNPRNAGVAKDATASGRARNEGCGDEVQLSLRLEGGAIAEVRFLAQGCLASIACASRLTELVRGRTPREALRLDRAALAGALDGLPPTSQHAAQLALDALYAALGSGPGASR
jgi:nitrogen fixation protein NifU and related proteins